MNEPVAVVLSTFLGSVAGSGFVLWYEGWKRGRVITDLWVAVRNLHERLMMIESLMAALKEEE